MSGAARPTEDAVLVARLVAGEPGAFAEAVRKCAPAMLRVARSIVKRDAVAEEVVQDAWISALGALTSFEGRSSLKTWLVTIAAHTATRRLRSESKTVATGDVEERLIGDFNEEGRWVGVPGWVVDGVAEVERRELRVCVAAILEELPPIQAAVLNLRDLEGWDAADVCRALELTEGNQRVLLHRARQRVRARWVDLLERRKETP